MLSTQTIHRITLAATLLATLLAAPPRAAAARQYYPVRVEVKEPGARVHLGRRSWPASKVLYLRIGRSYTLRVTAPGQKEWKRRVLVKGAETLQVSFAPTTGKVFVHGSADDLGAVVLVNGKATGQIPDTLELSPGRHLLRVVRPGHSPWQRWIDVAQGATLNVMARLVPLSGKLAVSCNVAGASVLLDGKLVGSAPLELADVATGRHVVTLRAAGHAPAVRVVEVKPGEVARLAATLEAEAKQASTGRLVVLAEPAEVDVHIDGTFRSKSPATVEDLAPGTHIIEVKWPGYSSVEREVRITAGQLTTVKIKLVKDRKVAAADGSALPHDSGAGHLLVASSVRGAAVSVDGRDVGTTPLALPNVVAGTHRVRVSAAGYLAVTEVVRVAAGRTARVAAVLQPVVVAAASSSKGGSGAGATGATPGDQSSPAAGDSTLLFSRSALTVPPGSFTAEASMGFPHLVEVRLRTGIFNRGHLALDAGIDLRTYGQVTEVAAAATMRLWRHAPFSVAAFAEIGGGGGPTYRETFLLNLGAKASLSFKDMAVFTTRIYANIYSDRHCPEEAQDDELETCAFPPGDLTTEESRVRFDGARLLLSAGLEVAITSWINAFAYVEGSPFTAERHAFTDAFASFMPDSDPLIYGRGGVALKF